MLVDAAVRVSGDVLCSSHLHVACLVKLTAAVGPGHVGSRILCRAAADGACRLFVVASVHHQARAL
eukprot:1763888-Lingulodinium_polyedra.AAC.1